jgi:predicted small metal-binding protein
LIYAGSIAIFYKIIFMECIMKTMTCTQLGGACEKKFQANSFEEIVELSKTHGMEMFQKQDAEHLEAMARIQALMQQPQAMQNWFESKKKEFDTLADD